MLTNLQAVKLIGQFKRFISNLSHIQVSYRCIKTKTWPELDTK